ncbi:MAG TPA: hypothetical protein PKC28_03905 [Bdellovibrionales bacterium]|nr:hypothetical protein [Bdellovibrionales bacterium]
MNWEVASYVVTVVGFPFAIGVFIWERRRERQNEDEEIYQRLSEEYAKFSELLLENADLRLMTGEGRSSSLTPEQSERRTILFDLLLSLFERAYILVYESNMNEQTKRLWASWDDYIRFWCAREDFRELLPELLSGEDPDFDAYIRRVAAEVAAGKPAR